ncbi:hypothetical protein CBE89_06210 [Corynebacterium striatum]|uniref:DUF262 domain-containing protein n=1 Tax=Corynebacterium striatum TaxID=43770 RepID=A0A2Z2IXG6_CORST|nr:DUF262 domain-containing protein [Corynebacterium striatum]ART21140.1 hypothetical protein CBE89_06210 [Corynebacterium striatum]HCG2961984.1 DUF262 domain-containing protein [Corynebacterium striatum]
MVAAGETTLRELLEGNKQYLVPLYQRPYQWGDKQLKQLWSDLLELAEIRSDGTPTTHFIGSVVLVPPPQQVAGTVTQYLVVDGQQRLTTLSLLLAAIRDSLGETSEEEASPEELHNSYLVNQYKKGKDHIKLIPTQSDRDSYNAVIERLPHEPSAGQIESTYKFFRGKLNLLDKHEQTTLGGLLDAVINGLALVSISTGPDDNVHRIFQSLNNTGLKLTQGDLLRNYIFMRLPNKSEYAYEHYWRPLQNILSNEEIEQLFWIDTARSHPETKLTDTYLVQQRELSQLQTEEDILSELNHLVASARLYDLILRPESERSEKVRKRLLRLNQWGMRVTHPIMLRLLEVRDQSKATDDELADALHVIESYVVRRFLSAIPTTGLNRSFRSLVGAVKAEEPINIEVQRWLSTNRKFIDDDSLRTAILHSAYYQVGRAAQRRTFLEWLEETFNSREPIDTSSLTIEHVMPQTLSPDWESQLREQDEDYAERYTATVHTLGNLTLTGYNAQLSNKSFSWKREEMSRSGLRLSQSITQHETWGPNEIEERGNMLADVIIQEWPGPDSQDRDTNISPTWRRLRAVLSILPYGSWTSYGDLAAAIGTAAQPTGNFLAANPVLNAYRVLRSSGEVSNSFRWLDEETTLTPAEALEQDGIHFDVRGRAAQEQRLRTDDLVSLLKRLESDDEDEISSGA